MTKTKPTKIKSFAQLRKMLAHGEPQDFFINLGLVRSSKSIMLASRNRFNVVNEIDDSEQTLSEKQMYTHSNIGSAMDAGNFYAY